MAKALRHEPSRYGLELDDEGWTSLPALAAALRVAVEDVEAAVALPGKRRYEIAGDRVRARYGHSVSSAIEREPAEPPETLFHGTTRDVVPAILREMYEANQDVWKA